MNQIYPRIFKGTGGDKIVMNDFMNDFAESPVQGAQLALALWQAVAPELPKQR